MRATGIIVRSLILSVFLGALGGLTATNPGHAKPPFFDEERGVMTMAPLLEKVTPAVVNIAVVSVLPGNQNPLMRDPFFRRFFDLPQRLPRRRAVSAGSGVIVDAQKGYVLTNDHVVRNGQQIDVILKDGRKFRAKLIGRDPATDIALLQIKADRLAQLPLGDSDKLKVGDYVIAIGNPFGLGQTVTSGIVSALGRSTLGAEKYEDFIQTDASINPGNSGGALVNTRGELIGINTAIIAPGGGNVGIGFAVPSNMAKAVMAQLIKYGEVRRGRIGIGIQSVTPDIAEALGLPSASGALVTMVERGSAAQKAGIQAGDVILAMDGKPVTDANDLRNRVGLKVRGSWITLKLLREGKEKTVRVRIGRAGPVIAEEEGAVSVLSGARITEIPPGHRMGQVVGGVYVETVRRGSPAWELGLRPGDIITTVNRRKISSLAEFEALLESHPKVLALGVLRGETELFLFAR